MWSSSNSFFAVLKTANIFSTAILAKNPVIKNHKHRCVSMFAISNICFLYYTIFLLYCKTFMRNDIFNYDWDTVDLWGESFSERPVMWSFNVSLAVSWIELLNKHLSCWYCRHHHCNAWHFSNTHTGYPELNFHNLLACSSPSRAPVMSALE